jgi:hypothetical protein
MADLDEIMSGQGDTAPRQDVQTQEPAQEPQAPDGATDRPQEEADPVSGLRKALDEERGKRRRYKEELANNTRELAELRGMISALSQAPRPTPQPPPPPPDFFEAPDAFVDQRLKAQLEQNVNPIRDTLMFNARLTAEAIHTRDTVLAAQTAFDGAMKAGQLDPRDYQRVMQSPNPFHEAVQWHQRNSVLSEIGTDPQAYREKLRNELRAELEQELGAGQSQPQPSAAQPSTMPTSFAAARSAGPRTAPQWSGPKPLSELMPR